MYDHVVTYWVPCNEFTGDRAPGVLKTRRVLYFYRPIAKPTHSEGGSLSVVMIHGQKQDSTRMIRNKPKQ